MEQALMHVKEALELKSEKFTKQLNQKPNENVITIKNSWIKIYHMSYL